MNQNYVRKCEEYLQNIPSQKLPPPSGAARSNLSSRKLTQKPGLPVATSSLRQGRQSINNMPPPVPPPPAEGGRPKPKPPPQQTLSSRRRTPLRSPTVGSSAGQQQQQQGSKFIRPCCRPKAALGRKGSDNVNQNDDVVRVMDGTNGGGGGGGGGEGTTTERKTKTWDGILAASEAETIEAQIKSKAHSPSPSDTAPITSTFPKGTGADQHHPMVPNPSVTSLSTTVTSSSVAVRPASSSIAAVPPQPRLPVTEHVHRKPSSNTVLAEAAENQLQGINLFRFDPLRTLQFLTLELRSKLKPLLTTTTTTTTTTMANDATSVLKQSYKISKELLYAVKILTENAIQQQPTATACNCCCQPRDQDTNVGKILSKPTICGDSEVSLDCRNCLQLQNALDRLRAEQPGCLPGKEINYLQDPRPPEESSKASTATDQQQQQLQLRRLEGEIKRLQTMISDKQTTPTATQGLIDDLNRKLDEATRTRDEAQRKLLNATLENERLNFLLRSQCSTMTILRNDFSAIQSMADQQIDLLDQTHNNDGGGGGPNDGPGRSRSKSNTAALVFGGNHHRNYRYPSGSGGPPLATASERVVKLRHHYSFQNIAEKESDGGNDANDCHWMASQRLPQEPEVVLRLPSSTLVRRDAFQQQGAWKKNLVVEEAKSGTSEPSGSLSEVTSVRLGRFGPTKRALLIDSDRDDSLEKDLEGSQQQQQQSSSSSSSLSSLTSSQQQQLEQRYRGHERKEPRTTIGDNRRELPPPCALGDKPLTIGTTDDVTENFPGNTNNNTELHHIQNSKTNDCVSLAPGIDGMATNRQQLGPGDGSKKDTLPVLTTTTAKGKYPRDYGDKFERRESLLAAALLGPGLEEKELCQNRPIMGQIRSESEGGKWIGVLVGKIIPDDANEPASGQTRRMTKTTTTEEEFSIDFDDITLPSSPIPFRGRREGPAAGDEEEEEFSSSFGDWM